MLRSVCHIFFGVLEGFDQLHVVFFLAFVYRYF